MICRRSQKSARWRIRGEEGSEEEEDDLSPLPEIGKMEDPRALPPS